MYTYHFREWLSFFYFYCIFGWCFESTYVTLKEQHPVNRGFLRGPWLPLYGSGAILVLWLTLPFQQTPALVYIVGALGATVLEYCTGEAMVRLFRVRYWDYSNQRFQYKGHICLSSSIAWGFLSLLMVYVVHKQVESFIFWMNEEVVSVMTFLITVLIVYDFSNALRRALDLKELLIQAELVRSELEQRAEEKRRLMEAVGTFARAAVEETLEGHLEEKLLSKEELGQRLDLERQRLEERQEQLKALMAKSAERLLAQNPGAGFISQVVDSREIRDRIKKIKEKISHS